MWLGSCAFKLTGVNEQHNTQQQTTAPCWCILPFLGNLRSGKLSSSVKLGHQFRTESLLAISQIGRLCSTKFIYYLSMNTMKWTCALCEILKVERFWHFPLVMVVQFY